MRSRVEEIPEPGTGADDGGNTERTVLGELEDLEVVENDRLCKWRGQRGEGAGVEKKCMATETGAEARDSRGRATQGSGYLAMSGASLQKGSDGAEQLGALEVVDQREAVLGEGASTAPADESGDAPATTREVGTLQSDWEKTAGAPMFGAGGPGAKTGSEIVQSFKGGSRPAHEE